MGTQRNCCQMALRLFKTAVVPLVSEGKPGMEWDGMDNISSFRWVFFAPRACDGTLTEKNLLL